ncbi:MAG: hypothetical protein ACREQJ_04715, partial [Candidatus Binatia bacterium]
MATVRSPCRICIYCGFELDVEDGRIAAARPDAKHRVSRGYACAKGMDFVRFLQGDGCAHTGRLVPLAAGHRERISFMPH